MAVLSAHALTTIEALKAELSIPHDDTSRDQLLARYINAASDAIRAYCGRDFARAHRVETVAGSGGVTLFLSLFPVDEVHRVAIDVQEVTDYQADTELGVLRRAAGWPCAEVPNIEVDYTGGYVTPEQARQDTALERTLPYDIEEACIVTAATWAAHQGVPRDATSLQVEQIRVAFATRESDSATLLPLAVRRLLGPYRRWA